MANYQSSQSAIWSFRWRRTLYPNFITTGCNRIQRRNCKNKLVRNTSFVKLSCNRFLEIGRRRPNGNPIQFWEALFQERGPRKGHTPLLASEAFFKKNTLSYDFFNSLSGLTILFEQAKKKTPTRIRSYQQDLSPRR